MERLCFPRPCPYKISAFPRVCWWSQAYMHDWKQLDIWDSFYFFQSIQRKEKESSPKNKLTPFKSATFFTLKISELITMNLVQEENYSVFKIISKKLRQPINRYTVSWYFYIIFGKILMTCFFVHSYFQAGSISPTSLTWLFQSNAKQRVMRRKINSHGTCILWKT